MNVRRLATIIGVSAGLGLGGVTFVVRDNSGESAAVAQVQESVIHYSVVAGDTWANIASRYNLTALALARQNGATSTSTQPITSRVLHIVPGVTPPTTTLPPASTTTLPPTTTVTTTTLPPSTTTTSTTTSTTVAPTTTTIPVPTTTQPPGSAAFVETFDNNTGLNRFRVGVFHRNMGEQELGQAAVLWGGNNGDHGGSWTGDHDLNCGNPDTQRPLRSVKIQDTTGNNGWQPIVDFNLDEIVYTCVDHVMTSMGQADGYSVIWFTPKQIFNQGQTKVSVDVGVTNELARKWWEVAIIPAGGPEATAIEWLAGVAELPEYPAGSVVFGNGPFGAQLHVHSGGVDRQLSGNICSLDPAGCVSKAIRRPFSMQDNRDGTVTFKFNDNTWTLPGSFPPGAFEVIFKDHNYTPDKDGVPVSHTWHWDNVVVT